MKNIHILPTDKPSRLFIDIDDNKLKLTIPIGGEHMMNQNIYITSNEEIKEGDYVYHTQMFNYIGFTGIAKVGKQRVNQEFEITSLDGQYIYYSCKEPKVVLTTDLDLIKDDVQPIDGEFLEWFVKNPSCEEVETYSLGIQNVETGESGHYKYEIIIPKEEPKQETSIVEGLKDILAHITKMNSRHEKQETLEEAAERIYPIHIKSIIDKYDDGITNVIGEEDINEDNRESFINGAKWQQERSYTEEEIRKMFDRYNEFIAHNDIEEWQPWIDKQFKKK